MAVAMDVRRKGDSHPRLVIDDRGIIGFGDGSQPLDTFIGRVAPDVLVTDGMIFARRGVRTRVMQRPPRDSDLARVEEGVSVVDAANLRVYFKVGGEWRYAELR